MTLLAGLPLWQLKMMSGHDALVYLPRNVEFFRALQEGDWRPRWSPDIGADYPGDANFNGGFSNTIYQVVNSPVPVITSIRLTFVQAGGAGFTLTVTIFNRRLGGGPSNQSVFTIDQAATLTPYAASALRGARSPRDVTPTGTVTFTIDGTTNVTHPMSASGSATYTTNALALDAHTVAAQYMGTRAFVGTRAISQVSTRVYETIFIWRMHGMNHSTLSRREREIAGLVATGASNKEIARKLTISMRTVQNILTHVFVKTGTRSRTELAIQMIHAQYQAHNLSAGGC